MKKIPLLIIGSSGHAKVIIDIVEKMGYYFIIGLIDPFRGIGEKTFSYEVLGSENELVELFSIHKDLNLFIAIGDNFTRKIVKNRLVKIKKDILFAKLIHPSAHIGEYVEFGMGVSVMAGVSINSGTKIGDFVIVNTNSSIDHDCLVEDFASIAPGVAIGGNCKVGNTSAISIGAIMKNGITVGCNSIIGAGALLLKDCPDFTIMFGSPAIEINKRSEGDKYL